MKDIFVNLRNEWIEDIKYIDKHSIKINKKDVDKRKIYDEINYYEIDCCGKVVLYDEIIDKLEKKGWIKKRIIIDENSEFVKKYQDKIDIICPINTLLMVKSVEQSDIDLESQVQSHRIVMKIVDIRGVEIKDNKMLLFEVVNSDGIKTVGKDFYSIFRHVDKEQNIKEDNRIYRWRHGFWLHENDILRILFVEPDNGINLYSSKFMMEIDKFEKTVNTTDDSKEVCKRCGILLS